MIDTLDAERRSALMKRVRRAGTAPELAVRRALRSLGVGYRLQAADLPGRPDVVMRKRRIAIFVHGCFWHGHEGCRRGSASKSNAAYWRAKIERNRSRDRSARAALEADGWRVLTLWECETRNTGSMVAALAAFLREPAA